MTLSINDYLPKAPSLNTITLGIMASAYGFGGGHNSIHNTGRRQLEKRAEKEREAGGKKKERWQEAFDSYCNVFMY